MAETLTLETQKLKLKQQIKEETLILNRISHKQTLIDGVHKQIIHLFTLFFLFHALLLLFSLSSSTPCPKSTRFYRLSSHLCTFAILWVFVRKINVESRMQQILEREKIDAKLVEKCVDEIISKRLVVVDSDLLGEIDEIKGLRREIEKDRKKAFGKNLVFCAFSGVSVCILFPTRLILCGRNMGLI